MPENAPDLVVLGRLTVPWGVKGFLRLHPFGDDPAAWKQIPLWYLGRDDKVLRSDDLTRWSSFGPQQLITQGAGWVVRFEGIEDRTAAEALAGLYCAARQVDLPPTADNEFYWADLVGMAVWNREGRCLGTVHHLISTGAHDVLCVRPCSPDGLSAHPMPKDPPFAGPRVEHLIPFVPAYVGAIDRDAKSIQVDWHEDWS